MVNAVIAIYPHPKTFTENTCIRKNRHAPNPEKSNLTNFKEFSEMCLASLFQW